jgi:hypothetical protein
MAKKSRGIGAGIVEGVTDAFGTVVEAGKSLLPAATKRKRRPAATRARGKDKKRVVASAKRRATTRTKTAASAVRKAAKRATTRARSAAKQVRKAVKKATTRARTTAGKARRAVSAKRPKTRAAKRR